MSMNDPISDSLTRIRNAQVALHEEVELDWSRLVESLVSIMKTEGFILDYTVFTSGRVKKIKVELKYRDDLPVIRGVERLSKPGRRKYVSWKDIKPFLNNTGVDIYSTPKGVITGKEAKYQHVGGELICRVW